MHDIVLNKLILNLTQNYKILEQNYLQILLKERGHSIPQSTLSRKLKKLKIVKKKRK